jgi:hypothetical protein
VDYDVIRLCKGNKNEVIACDLPPLRTPISSLLPFPLMCWSPPTMYNYPESQRRPSSATPSSHSRDNDQRNSRGYGSTQERTLPFNASSESDRDVFNTSAPYSREGSARQDSGFRLPPEYPSQPGVDTYGRDRLSRQVGLSTAHACDE